MLTNHAGLAKVSGTPGKTQLINHFTINRKWYLVDLPGYGYARTSKSRRESFAKIITQYVTKARKLHLLFVLIDSRLEPQRIDIEFLEMLGENGIPFAIVFTKADKLSKSQLNHSVKRFEARVLEMWEELPPTFITSAEKKVGRDEVLNFIGECLEQKLEIEEDLDTENLDTDDLDTDDLDTEDLDTTEQTVINND